MGCFKQTIFALLNYALHWIFFIASSLTGVDVFHELVIPSYLYWKNGNTSGSFGKKQKTTDPHDNGENEKNTEGQSSGSDSTEEAWSVSTEEVERSDARTEGNGTGDGGGTSIRSNERGTEQSGRDGGTSHCQVV
jgi:hypothetical protein